MVLPHVGFEITRKQPFHHFKPYIHTLDGDTAAILDDNKHLSSDVDALDIISKLNLHKNYFSVAIHCTLAVHF